MLALSPYGIARVTFQRPPSTSPVALWREV
jgi:hypothetical protein